ncbi:MAG: hypothetical protein NDF58_05920 [archaeon YNP-LCB-024-027]|nr:hypothetical protein [Candidatus Culexarchaeum yellowstonense]
MLLLSYIDEADPNHGKALKLMGDLSGDRVVSRLTLGELVSVYSRAGLEKPLLLAMYSLKRIKAKIVEVDFNYKSTHLEAEDSRLTTHNNV